MTHAAARFAAAVTVLAGPTSLCLLASPASAQVPPIVTAECEIVGPALCDLIDQLEASLEPVQPVTDPVLEPLAPVLQAVDDLLGSAPLAPGVTPTTTTEPGAGTPAVVSAPSRPAAPAPSGGSTVTAASAASAVVGLTGRERAAYPTPAWAPTPAPVEAAAPAAPETAELVLGAALPPFERVPGNAPSILVPGLIAAILAMGVGEGLRRARLAGLGVRAG